MPVRNRGFAALALLCLAACDRATGEEPEAKRGLEPTLRVVTEHPQPMLAAATAAYRATRLSADAARTGKVLEAIAATEVPDGFEETPLRDVLTLIARKTGVPAGFDTRGLEDAGIDLETPVTGTIAGQPTLQGIRSLLEPLDLTVVVRHGRLLVTTRERSQSPDFLERFLYPVLPGGDPEQIAELIRATVAPETWEEGGGNAAIRPLPACFGQGLVVSQTEENHERIAAVLGGLDRAIWEADGGGDRPTRIVRTYPITHLDERRELFQENDFVRLCNDALPRKQDQDPEAKVFLAARDAVVVQSSSRAFHVMAAAIITSIDGVDSLLIEEDEDDPPGQPRPSDPPGTVQATSLRR